MRRTVPVLPVTIDISPGDFPNSINTRSQGTVTVAVPSTDNFDAVSEVDETSLTFGHIGDEKSLASCSAPKDLNHDKLPDLVCRFRAQDTGFQLDDTVGVLRPKTLDGFTIQGTDSVRIVH